MKWWQIKLRALKLRWSRGSGKALTPNPSPRGRGGKADYSSPAGTFVQYSTVYACCHRTAQIQKTIVVSREGLKQSDYKLWLN